MVSESFHLFIESFDDNNANTVVQGVSFNVSLINYPNNFDYFIQNHGNGTYTVEILSFKSGKFLLNITFFNEKTKKIEWIPQSNYTNSNEVYLKAYYCHPKYSIFNARIKFIIILKNHNNSSRLHFKKTMLYFN